MQVFHGRRTVLRILFVWGLTAVGLYFWSAVIPGVHVRGWRAAFAGAGVIGLLNALVWPLMIRIALPITVFSIGLGALALNAAITLAAAEIVSGFEVDSFWSGLALAIGLALVNTIGTSALAIDDDDFYYRSAVRRLIQTDARVDISTPGVVFVQIDGLAHEVLIHAIRNGEVATIAAWLRRGSHRLLRWETDWSSQTGASQAGILHGSNADMPAFRWWEKERKVAMVTNHPRDAMEIERRHSNGKGLLAGDGASRANVVSGDAPHTSLTMSRVLERSPDPLGEAYFTYFANPYNVIRTAMLCVVEIATELWNSADERRRDIRPRINRGLSYALIRAWTTVVQRDLQIEAVIGDMFAGRSVIYTDLLAYDEVAHHSGTERHDTLRVLRRIDRQLARLEAAADDAKRSYRFVVLSDHGQTQGPTFKQRWGKTLDQLVQDASKSSSMEVHRQGDESWGYLSGSLTEASVGPGIGARAVRTITRLRTTNGIVELGPEAPDGRRRSGDRSSAEAAEVVVLASGCLGLIYFARETGRTTMEAIDDRYPELLPTLRSHPGIGFLLVRSAKDGAVVLGGDGTNYLDQGRIDGNDPLAPYGANAAAHVKRADGFAHVADIMVNSAYLPETDEVFAFEELIGSHGGLGGPQTYPFIVIPSTWEKPDKEIVGAEAMHQWLRRWRDALGQPPNH